MQLDLQLYVSTCVSAVLALFCAYNAIPVASLVSRIITSIVINVSWLRLVWSLLFFVAASLFYGAHKSKPAVRLGVMDALKMYAFIQVSRLCAWVVLLRLNIGSQDLENTQKRILKDILDHASSTAYYAESGLNKLSTRDEYLSTHPLTTYDHYRNWIDKIIDGEKNVLCPEKVDLLVATTGTTSGKSKLFPKSKPFMFSLFRKDAWAYLCPMLNLPRVANLKPIFDIAFKSKVRKTKSGIKIGTMSSLFQNMFGSLSVTPVAAKQIPDMATSFYVQLLFALKERDVGILVMGFGSHAYTVFKIVDERWPDLVSDIRRGEINKTVVRLIPPYLLSQLRALLRPNPQRANELTTEFQKGTKDYVVRVWPNASVIMCVVTGQFAIYKSMMEDKYTKDLPFLSWIHGSSECTYGINLWPRGNEFILLPNTIFYEFIEETLIGKERNTKAVLAHQVEIGKRYEIVVTTYEGLYRYKSNDVIEITRFHNQCPVYVFIQRADDNLSVYGEKTPVSELSCVLEAAAREWSHCDLVDFTTTESAHVHNIAGGHQEMTYVVIIEMIGERPSEDQINQMDVELCCKVDAYRIYRERGRIGSIKVHYTAPGAFHRLQDLILSNNIDASFAQFKVPRVTRNEAHLRCLLSRTGDNSN